MYKAIISDFFNVIHRDPFQHWLNQNGLEREAELHHSSELLDIGEISDEEFYRRLSTLSGRPLRSVKAVFSDTSFIDREVVKLVIQVKQHYKTGLLSNSSIEYLWSIIDRHELEALFDVITVSAEVGLIKPDPRIFEHILDKLGVAAKEAIFIDDNPRNVEAAAALGIKSLVYTDIGALKKELAAAGVTI
jgi:HAD superfamily hydrolase (TIGR01509 family)